MPPPENEDAAPRLPLPSWARVIANLARQRSLAGVLDEYGAGFSDPALALAEAVAIRETGAASADWLRGVWPLLVAAVLSGSQAAWRAAERATEEPPLVAAERTRTVRVGIAAGRRAARASHVTGVRPPRRGHGRIAEPVRHKGPAPGLVPEGESLSERIAKDAEWQAMASAGLRMREWAQGMREDVRWQTVQALRDGAGAAELARRLSERWGRHGQNFALVAATELSDAYACGMLLALPAGSFVTVPAIGDSRVCASCRELLELRVFEVRHEAPEAPSRFQLETEVWPGKSNVGRDRDAWVPCIPLHPRCRHLFVPFSPTPPPRRSP